MSRFRAAVLLAAFSAAWPSRAADVSAPSPSGSEVRSILRGQEYPWYDAERDAVRPLMADPTSWSQRLARRLESFFDWLEGLFRRDDTATANRTGRAPVSVLPTLMMLAAGALFLYLLWRLWLLHDPASSSAADHQARIGNAARVAGLSPDRSLEGVDPWQEALRRRAKDPAGAVIWLFLDQLLALERAGLIRLSPGKTARQYAQSLHDPPLAAGLQATLGAFEAVYYGHRLPSPETLDTVWARAEAFRDRIQAIRGS